MIEPLNKNKKNVNYYLTMNIYGEVRDITNKIEEDSDAA